MVTEKAGMWKLEVTTESILKQIRFIRGAIWLEEVPPTLEVGDHIEFYCDDPDREFGIERQSFIRTVVDVEWPVIHLGAISMLWNEVELEVHGRPALLNNLGDMPVVAPTAVSANAHQQIRVWFSDQGDSYPVFVPKADITFKQIRVKTYPHGRSIKKTSS